MNDLKINDYDLMDRYENLKTKLEYVQEVKNSVADNRQAYRIFANQIGMHPEPLLDCISSFERNLLIEIYTCSEQLIKNFYYKLIEMGNSSNPFLNTYFKARLNPEKFSPNVKFGEIEKNINQELIDGFKFNINPNIDEIKQYNTVVKSRHTYAHRGNYIIQDPNGEAFKNVIEFIYYMSLELYMIVEGGVDKWKNYSETLEELIDSCRNAAKSIDVMNKHGQQKDKIKRLELENMIKDYSKNVKKKCQEIIKIPYIPLKCVLFKQLYEQIVCCSEIDLRSKVKYYEEIEDLNNQLRKYCVRKNNNT